MRASTRITLSALAFAVPITVLVVQVASAHRTSELAIERELRGLVVATQAVEAIDALLDARTALAADAPDARAAQQALGRALAAIRAAEDAGDGTDVRTALDALRARASEIELSREPDGSTSSDAAALDELSEFAALRMPGAAAAGSAPEPLACVDAALSASFALVRALRSHAGLSVDPDETTNALLAASLEWLPRLATDLTRLVHLRAQPSFGTSAEAGVVEQLVVDRVLPAALDRLASAPDTGALATETAALRGDVHRLATRVPALDEDERSRYASYGRTVVERVMAHARASLLAADARLSARAARSRSELTTTLLWSGAVTLITALFVAMALLRVIRPLARLSAASERIAEGDLSVRLEMHQADEIGMAARSFDRMAQAISERDSMLQEHAEQLEDRVVQKTQALQTVLDGIGEGILVVERTGVLAPERSQLVQAWLGEARPEQTLWRYLAADDEALSDSLELGFEQLAADLLPFDVAAAQMPARLEREGRVLALSYRGIHHGERLERVIVIVRDVTESLAREQADRRARELPALVMRALSNRAAFDTFIEEIDALLAALDDASRPAAARLRALHTLKGTGASHELVALVHEAHALEERALAVGDDALDAAATRRLHEVWKQTLAPLGALLVRRERVEISAADQRAIMRVLEQRVAMGEPHGALLERLSASGRPPIEHWLEPLASHAERLATRRGKKARVMLRSEVTHLSDARLAPVLGTLVHLVRNAVDHGLEAPPERAASGKPECGTISIEIQHAEQGLRVVVGDDGRGIDWDALVARARSAGLPEESPREDALFLDGVSSRDSSDDVSGRGIGLSAVRAAAVAVGGHIDVQTTRGEGTRFCLELPTSAAA